MGARCHQHGACAGVRHRWRLSERFRVPIGEAQDVHGWKELRRSCGGSCGYAAPLPNGGVAGCAADPFTCEAYTVRMCDRPACVTDDDCNAGSPAPRASTSCPRSWTRARTTPPVPSAHSSNARLIPAALMSTADTKPMSSSMPTARATTSAKRRDRPAAAAQAEQGASDDCGCRNYGYCALRELACEGDADCSAPLTCEANSCRFGSNLDAPEHVCRPPAYFGSSVVPTTA